MHSNAQTPHAFQIDYDGILSLEDHSRNIQNRETLDRYARLLIESVKAHTDSLTGHSTLRALLCCGQGLQMSDAPALEQVGLNTLSVDAEQSLVQSMGRAETYLRFTPDIAPPSPTVSHDILALEPQAIL